MHFYGMSDAAVLAMPIRRFWLVSKMVDRLRSETDLRAIQVSFAKTSQEALEKIRAGLNQQMGEIVEFEAEVKSIPVIKTDPAAIAMLKQLAGQKLGGIYR